jgi:hypothetical protein
VNSARFPLGWITIRPGALAEFEQAGDLPGPFLKRHITGDWGELDEYDKAENDRSVLQSWRILSAYRLSNGAKIWIITEADRSATTLLLPSEY